MALMAKGIVGGEMAWPLVIVGMFLAVGLILINTALVLLVVPLLAAGLLRLTADRSRMGAYCNRWWTNTMLIGLIVVSTAVLVRGAIEWVSGLHLGLG